MIALAFFSFCWILRTSWFSRFARASDLADTVNEWRRWSVDLLSLKKSFARWSDAVMQWLLRQSLVFAWIFSNSLSTSVSMDLPEKRLWSGVMYFGRQARSVCSAAVNSITLCQSKKKTKVFFKCFRQILASPTGGTHRAECVNIKRMSLSKRMSSSGELFARVF